MKAIVTGPGACGLRTLQRSAPTEERLRERVRELITAEFSAEIADDVLSSPTRRNLRPHTWLRDLVDGGAVMKAGAVRWRIKGS